MELIKRWTKAAQPHLGTLGWAIGSSIVGGGIGLLMATLWGRTVGW